MASKYTRQAHLQLLPRDVTMGSRNQLVSCAELRATDPTRGSVWHLLLYTSGFNTPELIYQTSPELLSFSILDIPKTLIFRRRFTEVCPTQITVTLNVSAKTTADIDTTMDVRVFYSGTSRKWPLSKGPNSCIGMVSSGPTGVPPKQFEYLYISRWVYYNHLT